jgi:hypothetical protein
MPGSFGYNSNRNVRTRSNGRRSRHGYNYWVMIRHCAEVNREMQRRKHAAEMFGSVVEAFARLRRH